MAALQLYPRPEQLPPRPPPAHEINFTHHFALDVGGVDKCDQYIYRHANGLCIVGVAPTHVALSRSLTVDYDVGKKSRADIKVSGKRKKDARVMAENSVLCKLVTEDGSFPVRCCVKGQLLEVNERLLKDPSLLCNKAATDGYIAILMPRPDDWTKAEKQLLSRDEYVQRRLSSPDAAVVPASVLTKEHLNAEADSKVI